jgi:hypothetical protein
MDWTLPLDPALAQVGSTLRAAEAIGDLNGGEDNGLRQAQPVEASMAFWTPHFAPSIARLKELQPNDPKYRVKTGNNYSIRDADGWPHVYGQLQKAREYYDGEKKGHWGRRYKRATRWIVDHTAPASQAIRLVPNVDYISPVLAAIEVVIEVSRSERVEDRELSSTSKQHH